MDYVAVPSAPYTITNVCLTRAIFSDPHNLTVTQTGQKNATRADHEVTTTSFQVDQRPDSMIKVLATTTNESDDRQRQTTTETKKVSLVDLPTKRQSLARLRFKKNKPAISSSPNLTEHNNQSLVHTTQSLEGNNITPGPSSHLQQDSVVHTAQPTDVINSPLAPPAGPSQSHQDSAAQTTPASDLVTKSNLEENLRSAMNQNMGVMMSSMLGHMGTTLVNFAVRFS